MITLFTWYQRWTLACFVDIGWILPQKAPGSGSRGKEHRSEYIQVGSSATTSGHACPFQKGGFLLRKLSSSDPSVLERIPKDLRDSQYNCRIPTNTPKHWESNGMPLTTIFVWMWQNFHLSNAWPRDLWFLTLRRHSMHWGGILPPSSRRKFSYKCFSSRKWAGMTMCQTPS